MKGARVVLAATLPQREALLKSMGIPKAERSALAICLVSDVVKLEGLTAELAQALRRAMPGCGGLAVLSPPQANDQVDMILSGGLNCLQALEEKAGRESPPLLPLVKEAREALDNFHRGPKPLTLGKHRFDFSQRAYIAGVVNVTPDSFFDGGQHFGTDAAVEHGLCLVDEGADILEVGGEAAGPGIPNTPEEEIVRVLPVIEGLRQKTDVPISVDTYKWPVAKAALEAGASIINDTQSLRSRRMVRVVAQSKAALVLMHFRGEPREKPRAFRYRSLMGEVCAFLKERADLAQSLGVPQGKIIVDPGIGFSKTDRHDLEVMRHLPELKSLGFPIMLGTSHRGFIGYALGLPVGERLEATAATVAYGVAQGANILRVHDVRYMRRVARMMDAMLSGRRVDG